MVLPAFLLFAVGVFIVLIVVIRGQPAGRPVWWIALAIGLPLALARASLACLGWYVVEHTGGPAQVPAFFLAMLSWPEAAFLPRRPPGATQPAMYGLLFATLTASTLVLVATVALIARRRPLGDRPAG